MLGSVPARPATDKREFVDTLAVAARQEEVPDTNYTWTVHYPHLHSSQEYDKARSAATLTPGSDGDAADAHQHVWDFDSGPVDEIREYSCKCGGEKQVIVETREDGTTTTIRIFEPAQGSDEDQDEDEAESEHENP